MFNLITIKTLINSFHGVASKFHSPISNFSGFTSTPIILVAPHILAPSATCIQEGTVSYCRKMPYTYGQIVETRNTTKFLQDHTANPIEPSPNMATVVPASTFAVLQAAPTPTNIRYIAEELVCRWEKSYCLKLQL